MTKFNPLDYPICFSETRRVALPLPWVTHIPFGMSLIDILKPKIFVELGVHSGNSYCSFCQAIDTLNLETKAYAVDLWSGDEHSGNYGSAVYTNLKEYHDPLYGSFSRLVKSSFDDAVINFDEGVIDLLHIDGYHTYEAVSHDFKTWLPKLSESGVVIFHDTNMKEADFGVWKFWEEISTQYPSFEFFHGHGLGILATGSIIPAKLETLLDSSNTSKEIHEFYSSLGKKIEATSNLLAIEAQLEDQKEVSSQLLSQLGEQKEVSSQLLSELREQNTIIERIEASRTFKFAKTLSAIWNFLLKPFR